MSATRQGMNSAEIDQIVAQRVTDAIEAIAIYETKICMTHDPMNQVIRQETAIKKNANNKRKFENHPKDNRVPRQPPCKKLGVIRAYTIRANERRSYIGNSPYCNKCKLHHVGPCTVKCNNYKRVGHMTRDCKASVAAMNQIAYVANLKATITCYECGRLGHFRNECQKSEPFDILQWWKVNGPRFPIVSKMARDILTIQISTVASEAAFSTGGRVLDPYRTRLSTTMVEALICTQDWVRKSRTQINWDDVEDLIKDDEIVKDMEEQLEKLTERDKAKQTWEI
ncbi:reverse transcriptase domain-containing protein [Tanacetum coccineum]